MADIELVIKIDEDEYKKIVANKYAFYDKMYNSIKNGTPLPKRHGRLIDMKNLQNFVSQYTEHDAVQLILADREDYIPTIIEADTESEASE